MSEAKPPEQVSGLDVRTNDYLLAKQFVVTALGRFIAYRLNEDRDVKMIITSHGSTTGTGKTTLAIILARLITEIAKRVNPELSDWDAKEHSFLNVNEYLQKYQEAQKGRVLISDELETMVDNRRSMSNDNVFFTEAWQMLRYKNVITIGTAPGIHTLDKRVMQTADVWINVLAKGYAIPYYVSTHDFTGDPIYNRFKLYNRKGWIRWESIEDNDYEYLKEKKKEIGIPGQEDRIDENDLKDAKRNLKLEVAENFIRHELQKDKSNRYSQEEIANITNWSQPKISQIKREIEAQA